MSNFEIEKMTILHTDDYSLAVGTSADNPNYIEIRTHDKRAEEWFGKISLCLEKNHALALGKALIDAASENKDK